MGILTIAPAFAQLEEIVVTAQRREEDQQKVPISIATASADTLASMGVRGTDELSMVAPGLTIQRQIGSVLPYIRGIGNPNTSGGQESAVALYVDGFYYAMMPSANFSLNNIERIEVLRGPQGTLFGRNATGGLIQVVTKDPSHKPSARVGVSYDDYETIEGNLYATGGLGETFAADLAFYGADQGEGYGTNIVTGEETLKRKEAAVRSTLLYTPTERTTVRVGLDYVDTENSVGIARQAAQGALTVDGVGALPDFWDVRSNYKPVYRFDGYGIGAKISHEFAPFTLVSLTGFRDGSIENQLDQDSTPIPIVDALIFDDSQTFSQELQLLSNPESSLEWIAGLYYFDFDVDYGIDLRGAAFTAVGGAVDLRTSQDTTSWAAYAQTAFDVWEGGRLTLGVRYTDDERKFSGGQFLPNAGGIFIPGTAPPKTTADEFTWRVALDHQLSDEFMVFASYNRGFKSGVYNLVNANQDPVEPELVDAYEVGFKADLLDDRLRLNGSVFYYDYQDLQQQVIFAGLTVLSNAATAEIFGGELELIAAPTPNLNVRIGVSVLDSEYTDYPGAQMTERNPVGGNFVCTSGQPAPSANCPAEIWPTLASQTATGNELARAPDATFNVVVDYTIPTSAGEFGIAAGYFYKDRFFWEPDNRLAQDSYGLLNANLSWRFSDGRYRVYVFGKNLTNEEYSQFVSGGTLGDVVAAEPPRTYGVGFDLNFE
jgi:iron complex outermembrane receptor protein